MAMTTDDGSARGEETEQQRLTRNISELLQELRVAQAGVQFLFGFLLAVAFTEAYARASTFQHTMHIVAVIFATTAVALLSAPAAWHRVLFRRGERPRIIEVANRCAIAGMACLAVATACTVVLLVDEVLGTWVAILIGVVAVAGFGTLWFVLPLRERRRVVS
jgi:predicted membrane channel-forming protein YqfA (hemolysin III family)